MNCVVGLATDDLEKPQSSAHLKAMIKSALFGYFGSYALAKMKLYDCETVLMENILDIKINLFADERGVTRKSLICERFKTKEMGCYVCKYCSF